MAFARSRGDFDGAQHLTGARGVGLGRLSPTAAVRIVGKGGPFSVAGVIARFPQHSRKDIEAAIFALARSRSAYRVSRGVYRLAGVV